MKADDLVLAAVGFACVVALGLVYLKKRDGSSPAGASSGTLTARSNAGGPYANGSWFPEDVQKVWSDPTDLPGWADL